ncbi:MAG: hypothetical protein JJ896_16655 [Rhodothermales bacterium]|nr:hypothetical protein [Rhodothermales bacterium]MBO6781289.1 hypothetical protein [Rhodothermales bacterium]
MARPSGNPLTRWFLGFFGAMIAVAILPRTLVFILRRMAGRVLAEALGIALLGYLAERLPARPPEDRA